MKKTLALLLLAAFLAGCSRLPRPSQIGEPAPEFTLADSGKQVSLRALRGKVVVLNFWATWCPPCVEEMPSLMEMQRRLRDQVTVLAVSLDQNERAYREFIQQNRIDLLTVRDPAQTSNTLYGTYLFPETYVIDRDGIVRRKFVGPVDWVSPEVMSYLTRLSAGAVEARR